MTAQSEIINLPEDYFLRSVWQAYGNPREALIRELLQNAVDAGATDIRFTLTDKTITIDDDGVGMTEEIIRPALLTLNGSYKRAGSAGGFGAAKELIILAHSNYEVLTNDVVVRGQNIRFTLSRADQPRKGTRITIEPHARSSTGWIATSLSRASTWRLVTSPPGYTSTGSCSGGFRWNVWRSPFLGDAFG